MLNEYYERQRKGQDMNLLTTEKSSGSDYIFLHVLEKVRYYF